MLCNFWIKTIKKSDKFCRKRKKTSRRRKSIAVSNEIYTTSTFTHEQDEIPSNHLNTSSGANPTTTTSTTKQSKERPTQRHMYENFDAPLKQTIPTSNASESSLNIEMGNKEQFTENIGQDIKSEGSYASIGFNTNLALSMEDDGDTYVYATTGFGTVAEKQITFSLGSDGEYTEGLYSEAQPVTEEVEMKDNDLYGTDC